MSFIQAYKELDNLCKDLLGSDTGITTYLEEMEKIGYSRYKTMSWDSDYKNLKKYRHMRNTIVHDNLINEANACTPEDELWIRQFHQRILNQQDPLALHRQATNIARNQTYKAPRKNTPLENIKEYRKEERLINQQRDRKQWSRNLRRALIIIGGVGLLMVMLALYQ